MNRFLGLIICAVGLVGASWIEARACTCALPLSNLTHKQQVKKAKNESSAVFVGKVMKVVRNPDEFGVSVKFQVDKIWKGKLSRDVTIFTGRGGGDCGYQFEVGGTYLVYATGVRERLSTSICLRTASWSVDGDVKHLGKGRRPVS